MAKLEIVKVGDQNQISVEGNLDENTVFSSIAIDQLTEFRINLQSLRAINSIGIVIWVEFMQAIEKTKKSCTFSDCPVVFIEQVAMFPQFVPKGAILESAFCPYVCTKCAAEEEFLIKIEDLGEEFPPFDCKKCDGQMHLDNFNDSYLKLTTQLSG